MNISRTVAATVVASAAVLGLAGCFQLPSQPASTPAETDATQQDPASDLAGTSWTGSDGSNSMSFTLNPDGTIDFTEWNDQGGFDVPEDTWTVDGTDVTVNISTVEGTLVFTGPAASGSMTLQGSDGTLTLTEQ